MYVDVALRLLITILYLYNTVRDIYIYIYIPVWAFGPYTCTAAAEQPGLCLLQAW
jgi:hypothetical protein